MVINVLFCTYNAPDLVGLKQLTLLYTIIVHLGQVLELVTQRKVKNELPVIFWGMLFYGFIHIIFVMPD